MSAKDQADLVVNHFVQLTSQLPTLGGMRRSGNAGSLPAYLFRDSENVALRGNDVIDRGGQAKYNPDQQLDGCGDGFLPPDEEPKDFFDRMLLTGTWHIDDLRDLQLFFGGLTPISTTLRVTSLRYLPGAGVAGTGGLVHVGSGFLGADISPAIAQRISLNDSDEVTVEAGNYALGGDGAAFGQAEHFDGLDWVVGAYTDNTDHRAQVIVSPYDSGAAVSEEVIADNTVGGHYPMWLRNVSDTHLVCPLEPSTLHFRDAGSGAVWATATLNPGARAHRLQPHAAAYYDVAGSLFFTGLEVGGSYAIFQWFAGSGSASTARALAGTPVTFLFEGTTETRAPLCVHNGVLWYAYSLNAGPPALGTYDGTNWTEGVFTFPSSDLEPIHALWSQGGRLWALRANSLWSAEFPHRFWRRDAFGLAAFGLVTNHVVR